MTSLRRPFTHTLLAVLMSVLLLTAATPATSAETRPTLAGTTTLEIPAGASSLRIDLPAAVTLTRDDFKLDTSQTDAALIVLSPRNLPPATPYRCRSAFPEQDDGDGQGEEWCQDYTITHMAGWELTPNVSLQTTFPVVSAQVFEVYAVSDWPLTMTITVPELDGSTTIAMTGTLAGAIQAPSPDCLTKPIDGCAHSGFGGVEFTDIVAPARVGSVVFAQRHNRYTVPLSPLDDPITPGFHNAGACVYPSIVQPEKTSDPDDRDYGCDADDLSFTNNFGQFLVTQLPLGVSIAHLRAEWVPIPGSRYAGFAANQLESTEAIGPDGAYGAYAYWFSREISCPSGDWHDC